MYLSRPHSIFLLESYIRHFSRVLDLVCSLLHVQYDKMGWFQEKVVSPVKNAVTSGLSAKGLALSLSVGLTAGVFPVPGLTTLPTVGIAYLLGVNIVVAQVVNMCAFLLNIATVVPFMMIGRYLLNGEEFTFSLDEFEMSLDAIKHYARPFGYGVFAWTVLTPFMIAAGYYMLLYPSMYIVRSFGPKKSSE